MPVRSFPVPCAEWNLDGEKLSAVHEGFHITVFPRGEHWRFRIAAPNGRWVFSRQEYLRFESASRAALDCVRAAKLLNKDARS